MCIIYTQKFQDIYIYIIYFYFLLIYYIYFYYFTIVKKLHFQNLTLCEMLSVKGQKTLKFLEVWR